MSVTYSLFCTKCKVSVWIGQSGGGKHDPYIYNTEKEFSNMNGFLNSHMDHPLIYSSDFFDEEAEYEEYSEDTPSRSDG